jgi:hypothetical protein
MISKYCTYLLKIYKTLSLVDVIKKKAWRRKLRSKKIFPYFFCSLKRKKGQVDFDIYVIKDNVSDDEN